MLSSAHVLAMDAKNLLDVVDAIRIQYPHVNSHIIRGGGLLSGSGQPSQGQAQTTTVLQWLAWKSCVWNGIVF
jgi:phage/plasmid primase-like uncharacterized protein